MKPLKVVSIQRGCVYDGPGVRTTVFLKGCTLRCPWCCNPEAISMEDEWFVEESKCLLKQGKESEICAACERSGGDRSIAKCPFGVANATSQTMAMENLLDEIYADYELFQSSGGGVTFSGGEPLLYAEELLPLLRNLKNKSISVFVETSLCVPLERIVQCKDYLDGVIIDLKFQPEMMLGDEKYLNEIREKIRLLEQHEIIYRLVFVNSMEQRSKEVIGALNHIGVMHLELLKCHDLAKPKYTKLNRAHVDYTADEEKYKLFAAELKHHSIDASLLKI